MEAPAGAYFILFHVHLDRPQFLRNLQASEARARSASPNLILEVIIMYVSYFKLPTSFCSFGIWKIPGSFKDITLNSKSVHVVCIVDDYAYVVISSSIFHRIRENPCSFQGFLGSDKIEK